jgi:hypothetical protein
LGEESKTLPRDRRQLKLTDRGPVDVTSFRTVPLIVETQEHVTVAAYLSSQTS